MSREADSRDVLPSGPKSIESRQKQSDGMRGRATAAKAWPGFLAPDGTAFTPVVNLAAFCRDHDLNAGYMYRVARGDKDYYRGWTRYDPVAAVDMAQRERARLGKRSDATMERIAALKRGNSYNAKSYEGLVSPSGQVFKEIRNLDAFCRQHGLTATHAYNVANGRARQHKGWTRFQVE